MSLSGSCYEYIHWLGPMPNQILAKPFHYMVMLIFRCLHYTEFIPGQWEFPSYLPTLDGKRGHCHQHY